MGADGKNIDPAVAAAPPLLLEVDDARFERRHTDALQPASAGEKGEGSAEE